MRWRSFEDERIRVEIKTFFVCDRCISKPRLRGTLIPRSLSRTSRHEIHRSCFGNRVFRLRAWFVRWSQPCMCPNRRTPICWTCRAMPSQDTCYVRYIRDTCKDSYHRGVLCHRTNNIDSPPRSRWIDTLANFRRVNLRTFKKIVSQVFSFLSDI